MRVVVFATTAALVATTAHGFRAGYGVAPRSSFRPATARRVYGKTDAETDAPNGAAAPADVSVAPSFEEYLKQRENVPANINVYTTPPPSSYRPPCRQLRSRRPSPSSCRPPRCPPLPPRPWPWAGLALWSCPSPSPRLRCAASSTCGTTRSKLGIPPSWLSVMPKRECCYPPCRTCRARTSRA